MAGWGGRLVVAVAALLVAHAAALPASCEDARAGTPDAIDGVFTLVVGGTPAAVFCEFSEHGAWALAAQFTQPAGTAMAALGDAVYTAYFAGSTVWIGGNAQVRPHQQTLLEMIKEQEEEEETRKKALCA